MSASTDANMLISVNPSDGVEVGRVEVTPASAIPRIVSSAWSSGHAWRMLSLEERALLLMKAGEQLVARADELGELLSREMGKPLRFGVGEVNFCGAGIGLKVQQMITALQSVVSSNDSMESKVYYDPFGVCAVISPWNYPVSMPQSMVLPALMAGNSVVLKPSEETPLIAQEWVNVLNEFLPPGVLQIVHGGDEQGRELVAADVDLIAFTGSRHVGMEIMRSAANGLKRLVLELGGKDPLIVLPDADIEKAAAFAVDSSFENSGQMCVSTERIYVHGSIADRFEQLVKEKAQHIRTGAWNDEKADIGPLVNAAQRRHVIDQIRQAVEQGAKVLCGGVDNPPRYINPTVLACVSDDMEIMIEETFGPVACIARYSDIDDAVERANNTLYGLGAAVFGSDEARAITVARRLEAGMVGVNKGCFGTAESPWVGARQSGYGFHGSIDGHRQFAQVRVVSRPIGDA